MPSHPHCADGRKLQRVSLEQHWKMHKWPIADPEIELFLENSWNLLDGEAGTWQTQTPTRCYRCVRDVSRTSRVLERWSVHSRQAWAGRHPAAVSREHRPGRRLSVNIVGNHSHPQETSILVPTGSCSQRRQVHDCVPQNPKSPPRASRVVRELS